jgi:N-acetyl-alpha-D-muramate 1-phosphate uridylyltransferase
MILAAGRGERMRPLTDATPKPLLAVRGTPLLRWHVDALQQSGFHHMLVNTAWLGEQIAQYFESVFGVLPNKIGREQLSKKERPNTVEAAFSTPAPAPHIAYSHEGTDFGRALETAGGILRALPQLDAVFWVLAADVFAPTYPFSKSAYEKFAQSSQLAHIWLVPNPAHNPQGDFGLSADGLALNLPKDAGHALYTYSTIGLYKKALFAPPFCAIPAGNPQGIQAALAPLLRAAMDAGLVSAEIFYGEWADVGTPQRLAQLNAA